MKANELRIGNKVGFYKSLVPELLTGTVTEIAFQENSSEYYFTIPEFNPNIPITGDALKPIPLTEDWLLKFGFEKHYHRTIWQKSGFHDIWKIKGEWYVKISKHQQYIDYVHQLQNLYFALTGEELKLST